jgi:hypothetical protein
MPQMGITGIAHHFYTRHSISVVLDILDCISLMGCVKWAIRSLNRIYSGVKEFVLPADTIIFSRFEAAVHMNLASVPFLRVILNWAGVSIASIHLRISPPFVGRGIVFIGEISTLFQLSMAIAFIVKPIFRDTI